MSSVDTTNSLSVNLKSIALPAQHGVWGFWLEPSLAALIAAPSWAGLCLSLAALSALLLHHPLTVMLKDYRRRKRYARTLWAERFVLLYGSMALIGLLLAVNFAPHPFMNGLLLAVPFALVQIGFELRNQVRHPLAEISGAIAFAALAPTILLMSGREGSLAMGLWAVLVIRAVVSILYIRARLRLEKGKPAHASAVLLTHMLGLSVLAGLMVTSLSHWLNLIGGLVLLIRAGLGVSPFRTPTPAKVIGFREIAYGLIVALLAGVGMRLLVG
ncbi:MAG: YwiC-like family protein [Anaerolineae bacterium]|nr:YwiC-like family protein [Anaerolineae bacterium]